MIGPRPVVEEELAAYGDDAGELLSAKPGITGWWQVQARNDATYGDGSRQELELSREGGCRRSATFRPTAPRGRATSTSPSGSSGTSRRLAAPPAPRTPVSPIPIALMWIYRAIASIVKVLLAASGSWSILSPTSS